jgi:hypothetical protein
LQDQADWLKAIKEARRIIRPGGTVEFSSSGFSINGLHAVEGMACMDSNFFQSWNDPHKKKTLLEPVRLTEQDQSLLCFSPHMMISASLEI